MSDTIRDLATWYPCMPMPGEMPTIVTKILDACIRISLAASDDVFKYAQRSASAFGIPVLRSILNGIAEVRVELATTHATLIVPVLVGADAQAPVDDSYIVLSEPVEFVGSLELHPDCLFITQETPGLYFYTRTDVSKDDGKEDDDSSTYELVRSDGTFQDGYNVSVTCANDTIRFSGMSGAGLGIYTHPPYRENDVHYNTFPAKGLRSINGMTGNISMPDSESGTVRVRVADDGILDNVGNISILIDATEDKRYINGDA